MDTPLQMPFPINEQVKIPVVFLNLVMTVWWNFVCKPIKILNYYFFGENYALFILSI